MTGEGQASAGRVDGHAVVLGASLAGLAAAASLAARFDRVTVVDRDELPDVGSHRSGVPQGLHAHLLLPGGIQALAGLLSDVASDLQRHGAHRIPAAEFRFHLAGGRMAFDRTDLSIAGATRPLIEGVVRHRVEALPGVTVLSGREVTALVTDRDHEDIAGVRIKLRGDHEHEDVIAADLVVDATGRGSRTPRFLEALGYPRPPEERMHVGVHYSTRLFHRDPDDLDGCRHVVVAIPHGERRGGLALAVESDRWLVTLVGQIGERPPIDLDGYIQYASSLWQDDLHQLVAAAIPIGEGATGGFPAYLRRRYDKVRRFPGRFVVVGDAICSLNPIYAQGMSVAILEAQVLGEVIDRDGLDLVGPRFFTRSRRLVDDSWTLATGADLAHPDVDGARGPIWHLVNSYLRRLIQVAHRDPEVANAFLEVNGLVARPPRIMRPPIVAKVLRGRTAAGELEPDRSVRVRGSSQRC